MYRNSANFDSYGNRGRGNVRRMGVRGFSRVRANRGRIRMPAAPRNYINYQSADNHSNSNAWNTGFSANESFQKFSPLRVTVEGDYRSLEGDNHNQWSSDTARSYDKSSPAMRSKAPGVMKGDSYSETTRQGDERLSVSPVSSKSAVSSANSYKGSLSPVSSKHTLSPSSDKVCLSPVSSNASLSPVSDEHGNTGISGNTSQFRGRRQHYSYSGNRPGSYGHTSYPRGRLGKRQFSKYYSESAQHTDYKQRRTSTWTRGGYDQSRQTSYNTDYDLHWKTGQGTSDYDFYEKRDSFAGNRENVGSYSEDRHRYDRDSRSPVSDYRKAARRVGHYNSSDESDRYRRQRHSRSPSVSHYTRRHSRSKSPYKRSDSSSYRRHTSRRSRSHSRRRSYSPANRHSRSRSYRHSRSPYRHSRSPINRRSRSNSYRRSRSASYDRYKRSVSSSSSTSRDKRSTEKELNVDLHKLTESASESISKTLLFADNAKPEELLSVLLLQNELIRKQQQIIEKKEEDNETEEVKSQRSVSVDHDHRDRHVHSRHRQRSISPHHRKDRSYLDVKRRSVSPYHRKDSRQHGHRQRSFSPYDHKTRAHSDGRQRSVSPYNQKDFIYSEERKRLDYPHRRKDSYTEDSNKYSRKQEQSRSSYVARDEKYRDNTLSSNPNVSDTSKYPQFNAQGTGTPLPPYSSVPMQPLQNTQRMQQRAPAPYNIQQFPNQAQNYRPLRPTNQNQPVQGYRYAPPLFPAGATPALIPPVIPISQASPIQVPPVRPFTLNQYMSPSQPVASGAMMAFQPQVQQYFQPQQTMSVRMSNPVRQQQKYQQKHSAQKLNQTKTSDQTSSTSSLKVVQITKTSQPKKSNLVQVSKKKISPWKTNEDEMPLGLLQNEPLKDSAEESRVFKTFGSRALLKWYIDEPPQFTSVVVKNGRGEILFDVCGSAASVRGTYKERIAFTGNTAEGRIEFMLDNCSYADEGTYVASYNNRKFKGPKLVLWIEVADRDEAVLLWQMDPVPKFEPVKVYRKNGLILFTACGQNVTTMEEYKSRVTFTGDTTKGLIVFSLKDCTHGDSGIYLSSTEDKECEGRHLMVKIDRKTQQHTENVENFRRKLTQHRDQKMIQERNDKIEKLIALVKSGPAKTNTQNAIHGSAKKVGIQLETKTVSNKTGEFIATVTIKGYGQDIILAKEIRHNKKGLHTIAYKSAITALKTKSLSDIVGQDNSEEDTVAGEAGSEEAVPKFQYKTNEELFKTLTNTSKDNIMKVLTSIIQVPEIPDEVFAQALKNTYDKHQIDLVTVVNSIKDHEDYKRKDGYCPDDSTLLLRPEIKTNKDDLLKLNIKIPEHKSLNNFVLLDSGDQRQRLFASFNWLSKSAEKCGLLLQWYSRNVYGDKTMLLPRLIRKCNIWVQGNIVAESYSVGGKYGMQLAAAEALAFLYENRPVIQKVAAKVVRNANRVTFTKVKSTVQKRNDLGTGDEAIAKACEEILLRYKNEDTLETLEIHPGFPDSVYVAIRKLCSANNLAIKASSCGRHARSSDKTSILTINKMLPPYEILSILRKNKGCSGGYRLMQKTECQNIAQDIYKRTRNCVELREELIT